MTNQATSTETKSKTVKIKVYLDGDFHSTLQVTARADGNFWNICRERLQKRYGGDTRFDIHFSPASLTASIGEKY